MSNEYRALCTMHSVHMRYVHRKSCHIQCLHKYFIRLWLAKCSLFAWRIQKKMIFISTPSILSSTAVTQRIQNHNYCCVIGLYFLNALHFTSLLVGCFFFRISVSNNNLKNSLQPNTIHCHCSFYCPLEKNSCNK